VLTGDVVDVADGRVQRGARNREAIVDALLALYDSGNLRPSAGEVADVAGVSARSVHNHFTDMEALRAEVATRQWARVERLLPTPPVDLPLAERIEQLVERRAEFFEAITNVRRSPVAWARRTSSSGARSKRCSRPNCAPRLRLRSTRSTSVPHGTRGTACAPSNA
jgi:AcrR family transcriptional regulator